MIVKESGDIFVCDCGFSWRRGKSGVHDCGDGYRKQIAELRAKLANPVVLPRTIWYEHDDLPREIPVLEKRLVIAGIHLAGFTVKGE